MQERFLSIDILWELDSLLLSGTYNPIKDGSDCIPSHHGAGDCYGLTASKCQERNSRGRTSLNSNSVLKRKHGTQISLHAS